MSMLPNIIPGIHVSAMPIVIPEIHLIATVTPWLGVAGQTLPLPMVLPAINATIATLVSAVPSPVRSVVLPTHYACRAATFFIYTYGFFGYCWEQVEIYK